MYIRICDKGRSALVHENLNLLRVMANKKKCNAYGSFHFLPFYIETLRRKAVSQVLRMANKGRSIFLNIDITSWHWYPVHVYVYQYMQKKVHFLTYMFQGWRRRNYAREVCSFSHSFNIYFFFLSLSYSSLPFLCLQLWLCINQHKKFLCRNFYRQLFRLFFRFIRKECFVKKAFS